MRTMRTIDFWGQFLKQFTVGEMTLATILDPDFKITKPLNGGAHTRSVSDVRDDKEAIESDLPMFVQEQLAGENLRLFSVGGELSCFHLLTSALDYREDHGTEIVQIETPPSLIEATHRLVGHKRFDYCAVDFRCRNGLDDPVFLEINSFPMFVRFDDAGKMCIVDAILDFLIDP